MACTTATDAMGRSGSVRKLTEQPRMSFDAVPEAATDDNAALAVAETDAADGPLPPEAPADAPLPPLPTPLTVAARPTAAPTATPRPTVRPTVAPTATPAAVAVKPSLAPSPRPSVAPTPNPGKELWRGDFETGDFSQWDEVQSVAADRAHPVTLPLKQGKYAARFEVRQGDNPLPAIFGRRATGDRAELVKRTNEAETQERWYDWYTMFAPDFPDILPTDADPYPWQLFTQWHQASPVGGSPPVYFFAAGDTIGLGTHVMGSNGQYHAGPVHWSAPMDRGKWHHFQFHVRWSSVPAAGYLELWHNGELVLPKTYVATLIAGQTNYLKIGLYRSDKIAAKGVVIHDGVVMYGPAGSR